MRTGIVLGGPGLSSVDYYEFQRPTLYDPSGETRPFCDDTHVRTLHAEEVAGQFVEGPAEVSVRVKVFRDGVSKVATHAWVLSILGEMWRWASLEFREPPPPEEFR